MEQQSDTVCAKEYNKLKPSSKVLHVKLILTQIKLAFKHFKIHHSVTVSSINNNV